jgi:hypothetical protein
MDRARKIINLIQKIHPLLSGGLDFFVSAGVYEPAEMPRRAIRLMSKQRSGLRISAL